MLKRILYGRLTNLEITLLTLTIVLSCALLLAGVVLYQFVSWPS